MKPSDVKPEHRTRRWIDSEIRYESHQGIHTYHQCECGRGLCRSAMCATCWSEVPVIDDTKPATRRRKGAK